MSLKFILLVFTTFLLVQSSFGRAVPEEVSENEIAPTESKDKDSSSSEEEDVVLDLEILLKKRKFALKAIHEVFEGIEEIKEEDDLLTQFLDKVINRIELNVLDFLKSMTDKEKEYLLKSSEDTGDAQLKKELYALLHSLYDSPSESGEKSEILTIKDKKRIFLAQQIVNYVYLVTSFYRGDIDEDEFATGIVDFYKETVKEYYDSLTKEEQEKKKAYLDFVQELTVESAFKETTDEEDAKELELLAEFFDLTELEKLKISVLSILEENAEEEDSKFISEFKAEVEKFSNSLPNEKSELKKSLEDHLEKLNNIEDVSDQLLYVATWMLLLKDNEEKDP